MDGEFENRYHDKTMMALAVEGGHAPQMLLLPNTVEVTYLPRTFSAEELRSKMSSAAAEFVGQTLTAAVVRAVADRVIAALADGPLVDVPSMLPTYFGIDVAAEHKAVAEERERLNAALRDRLVVSLPLEYPLVASDGTLVGFMCGSNGLPVPSPEESSDDVRPIVVGN